MTPHRRTHVCWHDGQFIVVGDEDHHEDDDGEAIDIDVADDAEHAPGIDIGMVVSLAIVAWAVVECVRIIAAP